MDFCLATFAAFILVIFTAARGAPTGSGAPDACADVRNSSMEFNQIAKTAVAEARLESKDLGKGKSSVVWIEAKDMCDPAALKVNSKPCVGKMLTILTGYSSAVEKVSTFPSCSEIANKVKPVLHKLRQDISSCVTSVREWRPDQNYDTTEEASEPILDWHEPLLCRYIMDRLFSFSILTARVFAVGDPALHSSSSHKCL